MLHMSRTNFDVQCVVVFRCMIFVQVYNDFNELFSFALKLFSLVHEVALMHVDSLVPNCGRVWTVEDRLFI